MTVTLDAAYAHLFVKDTDIALTPSSRLGGPASFASTVVGSYDSSVDIVSLQLTWAFRWGHERACAEVTVPGVRAVTLPSPPRRLSRFDCRRHRSLFRLAVGWKPLTACAGELERQGAAVPGPDLAVHGGAERRADERPLSGRRRGGAGHPGDQHHRASIFAVASIVSYLADVDDVSGIAKTWHIGLAGRDRHDSWTLIPTMFTTHYADMYYSAGGGERPLQFPDKRRRCSGTSPTSRSPSQRPARPRTSRPHRARSARS